MQYRKDIDGLRTIAVLPVVFYHAGLGLPGGFVGVDVFFVISGFLITYLLVSEIDKNEFSILNFYERRARRILPALFVMVFVTTCFASTILMPFDFEDFGKSVISTTLFSANIWFFLQQGYFTEAAELEPLLHAWSLGVEEQYYIVFPIILLILSRFLASMSVFVLILLLGLGSFFAATDALSSAPEAAFYLPHLRAWELLIGSLLAIAIYRTWWSASWLPLWLAHLVSIIGFGAIFWPIFSYSAETPFPGTAAFWPCFGAMLLIAVGSKNRSIGSVFLSLPPMVFVGKLSYSLYLWHWPVISLLFYQTGALTPLSGLACVAVSFVLAFLSWKFVEQPIRDRKRISSCAIALGSAAAILFSTSLGFVIWQLDVFPNRIDLSLLAMADSDNYLHDRRDCHFITPERARVGDVCIRGSEGVQPSFVLVGDSHADAFSPAVFAAASDLGVAGFQYTDSGFVPLPGIWRLDREGTAKVDAFISFLEERPSIRTIIITRYWQLQMTGYTYRHEGYVWVDEGYDGSGTDYNVTATKNGFERLVDHFPERRIVVLDDVPAGEDLHIRNQLRQMRYGDLENIGLSAQEFHTQRETYEPILMEISERFSNVHYVPMFSNMCERELCSLFDGETLLFRDGDHLSWEGSLRLRPTARQMLGDALSVDRN